MITVQIMLISKKLDLVLEYTAKNPQVATSLFTSCDNLLQVYNKPISGCVCMACDNKSVASCQQTCCKFLTDLLQVHYFNRLVTTCVNKL